VIRPDEVPLLNRGGVNSLSLMRLAPPRHPLKNGIGCAAMTEVTAPGISILGFLRVSLL